MTDKLQLNLGLRWDYETNGFNNDYIGRRQVRPSALRALPKTFYFDPENYISNGSNRKPFAGAFAPRFGFSYDITGNKIDGDLRRCSGAITTATISTTRSMRFRAGSIRLACSASPRPAHRATVLPTVAWNPAYLTRAGLIQLAATSEQGLPELFAVKNDAKAAGQ